MKNEGNSSSSGSSNSNSNNRSKCNISNKMMSKGERNKRYIDLPTIDSSLHSAVIHISL